MHVKEPYEAKYQFLITKRESTGLNHFIDPEAFIEYWKDMQDIYKNIEEYNIVEKRKILIVFDHMIVDVIRNKKNLIQLQLSCLLEVENETFQLSLLRNQIFKC